MIKTFTKCTTAEKQGAIFFEYESNKLNVWWEDLDKTTQTHAFNIGWTNDTWDDDNEIEHLDVEQLYWDDLDSE